MNELMIRDPFASMSNMFRNLEAMMDFDFGRESKGLKKWLHRPHNLITNKDKDGKIESYGLEVVYTPFKKDEVKIQVLDNVLTVKCGAENKIKDEDMDYCGISHQSFEFSIPLAETIDMKTIKAKAEDGILYITLPVKKEEKKEIEAQEIEIL